MYIADISTYQGNIDWDKARQELNMVIFRASVGNKIDTKYVNNAKKCDIPFGVYHYFKAGTKEEAEKEAAFFYTVATQDGLDPLFFCPDIEYKTQTSKTTKIVCQTILDTLRLLGAKKVGLYIGQSRYPYIKDIKDQFDFMWIPRYGKNTGLADETYAPKFPCDVWQYTSMGHINGIPNRVDLNKLYGNKDLEWFTKGGLKIEPPLKRSFFFLQWTTVRKGDNNGAVQELQQVLNKLGYDCGRNDGIFDAVTEKALKEYQKQNGLTADGVCGKKTLAKLIG